MKGKKQTSKKYQERKSPPYKAGDYKNKVMKGNDGNMYISKEDKNGVYKWVPYEKKEKVKEKINKKENSGLPYKDPNEAKDEIWSGDDPHIYYQSKKIDGEYKWINLNIEFKKDIDEYYKQFSNYEKPVYDYKPFLKKLEKIKEMLEKVGIKFYISYWNEEIRDWGKFEMEYYYADYLPKQKHDFLFVSERMMYFASEGKEINSFFVINHDVDKDKWPIVNRVLLHYFPYRTIGLRDYYDAIKIFFEKQKKLTVPKYEKVPYSVEFHFKNNKLDKSGEEFQEMIGRKIGKKIGYVSEYNYISRGKTEISFNIFKNKKKEFEKLIKSLKKSIIGEYALKDVKIESFEEE